jgi:hypothetical protein
MCCATDAGRLFDMSIVRLHPGSDCEISEVSTPSNMPGFQ